MSIGESQEFNIISFELIKFGIDNSNGLIQAKFYYSFDGDQMPAQLLASLSSEIDSAINDFNATRVK